MKPKKIKGGIRLSKIQELHEQPTPGVKMDESVESPSQVEIPKIFTEDDREESDEGDDESFGQSSDMAKKKILIQMPKTAEIKKRPKKQ